MKATARRRKKLKAGQADLLTPTLPWVLDDPQGDRVKQGKTYLFIGGHHDGKMHYLPGGHIFSAKLAPPSGVGKPETYSLVVVRPPSKHDYCPAAPVKVFVLSSLIKKFGADHLYLEKRIFGGKSIIYDFKVVTEKFAEQMHLTSKGIKALAEAMAKTFKGVSASALAEKLLAESGAVPSIHPEPLPLPPPQLPPSVPQPDTKALTDPVANAQAAMDSYHSKGSAADFPFFYSDGKGVINPDGEDPYEFSFDEIKWKMSFDFAVSNGKPPTGVIKNVTD